MSDKYGPAPLTFGQLGLWRDIDALPRSRWHEPNWVAAVAVPPEVSVPSIRAALDRLAERHGGLRTTYEVSDPEHPTQSLRELEELPLDFEVVTAESAQAIEKIATSLRAQPFDLRSERPYRAVLVDAPAARKLLFSKHHIAADAWSMDLLTAELTTMFSGNDADLPAPSENLCLLAQEQRSAAWRRRREASEQHMLKVLSTPAAQFREKDPAHGPLLGFYESARLCTVAKQVARECHVSLSTVVSSAFARAVSQLCTDDSVRFGLVASNRFGERWTGLVTSMNQMISIPLEPGDDCMQQPRLAALQDQCLRAYRLAMYDVDAVRPASLGLPADTDTALTCMYNIITPWVSEQFAPIQDGEVPSITWRPVFNDLVPSCYLLVCETTTDTLTMHLSTRGLGKAATAQLLQTTHAVVIGAGRAMSRS